MNLTGAPPRSTRLTRAAPDDAFRLAALHIARHREAGRPTEPGFLDRFGDAWLARRDAHPSWIVSAADGNPMAACTVSIVRDLPEPGRRAPLAWGRVSALYVRPTARGLHLEEQLVAEALRWCDAAGLAWVEAPTSEVDRSVLIAAGFDANGPTRLRRHLPRA